MDHFSDFILQVSAISAGSGALIILFYLCSVFPRSKRLRFALMIVITVSLNYLMGILTYVNEVKAFSTSSIVSGIFLLIQVLSALAAFYVSLLFIESLGTPRYSVFGILCRSVFVVFLVIGIILMFPGAQKRPVWDLIIYFSPVFLWCYLLTIKIDNPFIRKIQITGLIGFGGNILLIILQRFAIPDFFIHFADADFYLFLTISSMIFSISYLMQRKKDEKVSLIDIQEKFNLTKREAEVTELLLKSYSYKEIAFHLGITMPTVKTHVSRIYKKTGSQGKSGLHTLVSK